MMQDFMYEQTRATVTDTWDDEISQSVIAAAVRAPRVSYRIYYSQDNLTRRIFVHRGWPNCTPAEIDALLGLGFVMAQPGDADNIPDQPVEEEEVEGIEP